MSVINMSRRIAVVILLAGVTANAATNYTLVGWNNLGMHCMDNDFSVFSLLPPYNTIMAQLIDSNGKLVTNSTGITVTYQAIADPTGSINTTSLGKANFWDHVLALFGLTLPVNVGLPVPGPNSFAMPGVNNIPQAMEFEMGENWFAAYGIPLTPYDDAGNFNSYPLMRLTAKRGAAVLATTDIVLPISDEMDCRACHASTSGPAARPSAGWVNNPNPILDFRQNILRRHDDLELSNPQFTAALATNRYSATGLAATAAGGTAILCAACHLSEALPGSGLPGIKPLTTAMHGRHANVTDPTTGLKLDSTSNRTSCYQCHPGSTTKCLRGAMGKAVAADGSMAMQCQSCHGLMSTVAATTRTGWLDEPNCQSCHSGDAVNNKGQIRFTNAITNGVFRVPSNQIFATTPDTPAPGFSLYRFSTGHGGIKCEACHGSTHAEFPSAHPNDNIQSIQHQGHVGMLSQCIVCHGTSPSTITGGPHGLHPIGAGWVGNHHNVVENSGATQCQVCHGANYRGTVLSRSQSDQTLNGTFFWRGRQIGCYDCHNGSSGGDGGAPTAPSVSNIAGSTKANTPVTLSLIASTSNLRIVSQPNNGTVGLNNNLATYSPDSDFTGTDRFTFAVNDGYRDSNLATGTVVVTGAAVTCKYTVVSTNATISAGSGTNTINVTTSAGCTWTATSVVNWLTIHSSASGSGNGLVTYLIAANTSSNSRTGTLTVAGQVVTVIQAGAASSCVYTVTPATINISSTGGARSSATVSAVKGCAWTANSSVSWITIQSGAAGSGKGIVQFSISRNSSRSSRSGILTIAGKAVTINQTGAPR